MVECFQAGPLPADAALQLVSELSSSSGETSFEDDMVLMGFPASGLKVLFAALSQHSIATRALLLVPFCLAGFQ